MFKVRVIPCLDVKDGRVVKGVNFVNLRDAGDPVEAAIAYDAAVFHVEAGNDADFEHGSSRRPCVTDELECLRRIQPAVIECAAGNRPFEFFRTRLQ